MTNMGIEKTDASAVTKDMNSSTQNRVYSGDKNIWVGMTVKDAAKSTELMTIFDFADNDHNGFISDLEMDRYNGPIITHNVKTEEGRILGTVGSYISRRLEGSIIKDTEIDYYPGLTVDKVAQKGRKVFTLIDNDHNGVLSKEEVTKIVETKNKVSETESMIRELSEKHHKSLGIMTSKVVHGSAILGGVIGVVAGAASLGIVGGVIMGLFAGASTGLLIDQVFDLPQKLVKHYDHDYKKDANELVNKLEQEIGNEPYAQEYGLIDDLKKFYNRAFPKSLVKI